MIAPTARALLGVLSQCSIIFLYMKPMHCSSLVGSCRQRSLNGQIGRWYLKQNGFLLEYTDYKELGQEKKIFKVSYLTWSTVGGRHRRGALLVCTLTGRNMNTE